MKNLHQIDLLENYSFHKASDQSGLIIGNQSILKNITHGKSLRIGNFCKFKDCQFGNFWGCDDFCAGVDVSFGSFVSIGKNVTFNAGQHPTDYLSTHLVFFDSEFWGEDPVDRKLLPENERYYQWRKPMNIGNDVWIGSNAIIKTGIIVGNGAIIGANSIITEDVDDYAIVAGNPARLIRYRFDKSIIKRIQTSEWWNLPMEQIRKLPVTQIEETLRVLGC